MCQIKVVQSLLEVGQKQFLKVDASDPSGYYLLNEQNDEVFMPGSLACEDYRVGDTVEIFIFTDGKGEQLATSKMPYAQAGDFACLEVVSVTASGAFLDMGLPKDLLVPGNLQKYTMAVGQKHLIKILIDDEQRLFGTEKIQPYLSGPDSLSLSDIVKIIPFHRTPLGFKVLIEEKCLGVIYHNEIFQKVEIGKEYEATIKTIRQDSQVDLILGRVGRKGSELHCKKILNLMKATDGKLRLTDKSSPEEISQALSMSKKSFKSAIGSLYKQRLIIMKEEHIELAQS